MGLMSLSWKYSMSKRMAITHSAITPPKVNRFGWNLEQCEPNVGGWHWQILGVIPEREPNFWCFLPGNIKFRRFPIGNFLRHFNTTTSIGEVVKTYGTEFWKFYHKGSFFQQCKNCSKFPGLATSGRHNSAMITDHRKFTSKWSLYDMSSFHFYC